MWAYAGATAGGNIEDRILRVDRTEAAVPDGAADLVTDLYRRMPDARITDLLLEVDDTTRFTEAFTHLRTGSPCRDRIGLLNVLLAEGINLGLRKMAEATTTHGFLGVDAHRPLACGRRRVRPSPGHRRRGPGRASDGRLLGHGTDRFQRRPVLPVRWPRRSPQPGQRPVRGGAGRQGVLARLRPLLPFATQTIPATVHEAPYILNGLLLNETGKRVREQYADTGGFTDHVFAACSILGYAFVPRIRDLPPSKRLYVFDRAGVPKLLRPLVGGKVNVDLIDRNWADILRVAATMAAGTLRPSQISQYGMPYTPPATSAAGASRRACGPPSAP